MLNLSNQELFSVAAFVTIAIMVAAVLIRWRHYESKRLSNAVQRSEGDLIDLFNSQNSQPARTQIATRYVVQVQVPKDRPEGGVDWVWVDHFTTLNERDFQQVCRNFREQRRGFRTREERLY